MTKPLIDHIERHLGPIQEGWSDQPDGQGLPFQVVRTLRGPIAGADAYVTLGMSNSALLSSTSGRLVRQELVMVVRTSAPGLGVPAVLRQVAREALTQGRALLRGEVVGPRDAVFPGSKLEALYAAIPVYFADSFASCDIDGFGTVVFCWLIPISREEAEYVRHCGWERFEDRLAEENPDLADVFRIPMSMRC